jgi:hypothetical protein
MESRVVSARRLVAGIVFALSTVFAACGGGVGSGFQADGGLGGPDGGTGGPDVTVSKGDGSSGGHDTGTMMKLGNKDTGVPTCVKPTCADLDANCGTVTDKKCGGVIMCGTCKTGEACGAGGTPNQCAPSVVPTDGGFSGDGCVKETCASQNIGCGVASDGCGGMLMCGSCTAPQTCGGDSTKPGQCGCTGLCSQVATCSGTTTTDLIGTVYDPAGKNPLYNVLVYVPNNPSDPGLQPFPPGITCDVCGATAAGDPLVTTYTAADGTFTLSGVPVGASIPVVIQLGRWRRQFTIPITNACAANSVPAGTTLSMPANHTEGDLPRIAVVTGSLDPVECVLVDMGISQSEFTDPGGGGYINFFTADDPTNPAPGEAGPGAVISNSTPTQDALFAATGSGDGGAEPLINNYDVVILECEGYQETESAAQQTALANYLAAGGRVFGSDYIYDWFFQNPALQGAANWTGGNNCGSPTAVTGSIDPPPTNPIGTAFQEWLELTGVSDSSGNMPINTAFANVPSVIAPTQEWLYTNTSEYDPYVGEECETGTNVDVPTPIPIQFTFNTPLGAAAANQCGRVTFNDWHAFSGVLSAGTTFPGACGAGTASSPQEEILEFMLFDLSACVQPYTPVCTPRTCADQNIECGPAGDGCGNAIQCGSCATGMVCGGGGAGKCGTSSTTMMCMPETCASQGIQCGPAGDGCGNELQCGNCPTGEICGFASPGQCGKAGGA